MNHAHFTPLDQGLRQLQAWRQGELTIRRAGAAMMRSESGAAIGPIPLLLVDPRPDITDLVRVHHTEGDGEARYEWRCGLHPDVAQPSWAILRVTFLKPVTCRFALAFDLRRHRPFLDALVDCAGSCALITHPDQRPDESVGLTGIPIAELQEVLHAHGLARSLVASLRKRAA